MKRICILLSLVAALALSAQAQFIGYVGQQTVVATPTQLGLNNVSAPTIGNTVPNIGQGSHYVTYCITGGTASSVAIQIEGSVTGTAFFAISAQGTNTSGCAVIATGGYFPVVRVNLVTYVPNGTTLSATYTGTSGTIPFTGGVVSTQVSTNNVGQFGGQPMQTGPGLGGAGIPRVTISSDSSLNAAQSGTWNVNQAGIWNVRASGNAGAAFDAPTNAAMPANALNSGAQATSIGSNPAAVTGGFMSPRSADVTGNAFVRVGSSNPFNCTVTLSTATTTQCEAAVAAGLRAYVTGYVMNTTTGGTSSTIQLVYGTGSNCGTGTTNLSAIAWPNTAAGVVQANANQTVPLIPATANAICAKQTGTPGTTVVEIYGFVAP